MNQPVPENLIALKKHYQSICQQCDRSRRHANDQLDHINALLVDQLEDHGLVESLIALRGHYQRVVEECDRQAYHAKEQMTHVNALLADQVVMQNLGQPVSIEAATVDHSETRSLTEMSDIDSEQSPTQAEEPEWADEQVDADELAGPDGVVKTEAIKEVEESDELEETEAPELAEEVEEAEQPDGAITVARGTQSEPEQNLALGVNRQAPTCGIPPLKTPVLPQYQHLTKRQAVESILHENEGIVLHVDYIIRALHGELDADAVKAERGRMTQTLIEGTKKGLWDKVPEQPNCYTFDLKFVEPTLTTEAEREPQESKQPANQSRSKFPLDRLPPYQRGSLIDAVAQVVSENAGKIITTDLAVRAIYGKPSESISTKVKHDVNNALWRGMKQNRWQWVPGLSGRYTLDLRLLEAEPSVVH